MSSDLPVLVGMNNPYGADPAYALYPLPERATGHRIWTMLRSERPDATMSDYRDAFDRRNLQVGPWVNSAARPAANEMRDLLWGRTVVLFGAKVRDAFGMSATPYGSADRWRANELRDEFTYFHWLPHPSGLCQWYNDEDNRRRAARFLARLFDGEKGLLTI